MDVIQSYAHGYVTNFSETFTFWMQIYERWISKRFVSQHFICLNQKVTAKVIDWTCVVMPDQRTNQNVFGQSLDQSQTRQAEHFCRLRSLTPAYAYKSRPDSLKNSCEECYWYISNEHWIFTNYYKYCVIFFTLEYKCIAFIERCFPILFVIACINQSSEFPIKLQPAVILWKL